MQCHTERVRLPADRTLQFSSGSHRSLGTLRHLEPDPKHLSHAPRLCDTAAGRIWLIRIEDLADRSDTPIVEVRNESFDRMTRARLVVRIHAQPGIDERP